MRGPFETPAHLEAGELLPIKDGAGLEVRWLRGELWITQKSDLEDRIIRSGKSFVLDRSGLSVINALLQPAQLVVQPGSVETRHSLRLAA